MYCVDLVTFLSNCSYAGGKLHPLRHKNIASTVINSLEAERSIKKTEHAISTLEGNMSLTC